MMVADCTRPVQGLGNRLTVLCGAYAAAVVRGVPCVMVWRPGRGCRARWEDLFLPHPLVPEVVHFPKGWHRHAVPTYSARNRARQLRSAGPGRYTPEYWAAWRECARAIRLRPELALPEPPAGGYDAVHVRANVKARHVSAEWWRLRDPGAVFLSVDHAATAAQLAAAWPRAWWLAAPTSNRDMGNRGLEGVQAAARDMMMLCRARSLLAVGGPSTFRNIPHVGYQVPLLRWYEGPCP